MALTADVELQEIAGLKEFSETNRVRKKIFQSKGAVCEIVCYEPGQGTVIHHHPFQDEIFYVVEGEGLMTFEDRPDIPVKPGSVVFVPAGTPHGMTTNDTDRLVVMFTKGPGIAGKAARGFMGGA